MVGCGGGDGDGRTAAAPKRDTRAITVVHRRRVDARLDEWTLRTKALRDPTHVRVLLPAGYRSGARRRYPVLYLLHGAGADYRAWTRYGERGGHHRPGEADRRDARRRQRTAGTRTGTSAGRPAQPRWETYHVGELVPWVDATYRTVAARRGRAVAGLSMGGFGALSYAARHPRTFAAAASFSGALEIGSSAAWGPRSGNEARWRAHLPISIAARLRSLALLELRTGGGRPGPLDRRGTRPGCAGVPARGLPARAARCGSTGGCARSASATRGTTTAPGTHDWPYWRRDLRESLPHLARALAPA